MAAMAAAIFGSIFNEIENRALGPADRAVERGGVAGRVRPHDDRLAASVGAARADGERRQTRRHCGREFATI
jgi:hypothetical protein